MRVYQRETQHSLRKKGQIELFVWFLSLVIFSLVFNVQSKVQFKLNFIRIYADSFDPNENRTVLSECISYRFARNDGIFFTLDSTTTSLTKFFCDLISNEMLFTQETTISELKNERKARIKHNKREKYNKQWKHTNTISELKTFIATDLCSNLIKEKNWRKKEEEEEIEKFIFEQNWRRIFLWQHDWENSVQIEKKREIITNSYK